MRRTRIEHILSALPPNSDRRADIRNRQLRAITGREQVQQPARVATRPTRSPRRRWRYHRIGCELRRYGAAMAAIGQKGLSVIVWNIRLYAGVTLRATDLAKGR